MVLLRKSFPQKFNLQAAAELNVILGVKFKIIVNIKGSIMKNRVMAFLSVSAILLSLGVHASESIVKESKPIGKAQSLSKEDIQKGIENGSLCTDAKGLANSRGAIIEQNGKFYRCVKAYGENFTENKKLVWVELTNFYCAILRSVNSPYYFGVVASKANITNRSSTAHFVRWTVFKSRFCGFATQKYSTKSQLKNCRLARRYACIGAKMNIGFRNNYHWFSTSLEIKDLAKIAVSFHIGSYLHVTSFDSGKLSLCNEEQEIGWFSESEVSSIILKTPEIRIPHEQYDEWYFSKEKISFPEGLECFVNYSGFSLSEKNVFSETVLHFWKQLIELDPDTYIANGDNVVVVSKNEKLIRFLAEKA